MPDGKQYYWLKLKRDFFSRRNIRIIEAMPDGRACVLFYLKLLLESLERNGSLRLSDAAPYTDEMLSAITNTDIDTVRTSMERLRELGMVEVPEDGTICLPELDEFIGSETEWAAKKRKQRQRRDKKGTMSPKCPPDVPPMSYKSIEYRD